MRVLVVVLGTLAFAGAAFAGNVAGDVTPHTRVSCNLEGVCIDWNFAAGDGGFTTGICEAGGSSVWEYGATTYIPGAPGYVWGTVLNGDYLNNSGDGLCSPAFEVTDCCYLMEIYHYYDIESDYDGGNVTVNGVVVEPTGGYDGTISTSTSYYAYCVDLEDGFTGHVGTWGADCFDLSTFIGEEVVVCLDFGSDSSVYYPGWYVAQIQIGWPMGASATETGTWGNVKSLFR